MPKVMLFEICRTSSRSRKFIVSGQTDIPDYVLEEEAMEAAHNHNFSQEQEGLVQYEVTDSLVIQNG